MTTPSPRTRLRPHAGDVVITRPTARATWTIHQHPDPAQLTATSHDEAVHTARRFAAQAEVDVWVRHADSSYELLATYRVGHSARID